MVPNCLSAVSNVMTKPVFQSLMLYNVITVKAMEEHFQPWQTTEASTSQRCQ